VHESLLTTTVVLVLFKLICRGFYFIFSVRHVEGTSPTFGEVANNEAAFVWMMLIVILMNKVKVHLIYVRNQQLAGFLVRQSFTACYAVVFGLYVWNCFTTVRCTDGAKMAVFWLQITFMATSSIVSGLAARKLWKASNFGYQRKYRARIMSDEIMIQMIIISNLLLQIYPCAAFTFPFSEMILIVIFVALEVGPLTFILYSLYKELGIIDLI
jgi:hypothetical protein